MAAPEPSLPPPRATLRLQLHRGFPFAAARAQVPYFARLGISHLYLSPILTARAGSMHGYDVVDHHSVNPELGGEEEYRRLVATLREHGMGVLVDIVPNHMAVGGADNAAWLDLLEWGRMSRHAAFFDVDWDVPDPALHNRLAAPFLGKPYGEALADGELQLQYDADRGRFHVAYFDHRFPLAPDSYPWLLRAAEGERLTDWSHRMRDALRGARGTRGNAFDQCCSQFAAEVREGTSPLTSEVDSLCAAFDAGSERGRFRMHRLLERQHWRLAWWRTAPDEINWRRFFDIIDLAGLRIQDAPAFEIVHATIFRLYAEGLIDGLRIDHIDGLADPRTYCRRLRARLTRLNRERPPGLRQPPWIVVEKILAVDETLPGDWQVDGSTGYSFMNEVGALLHDPRGEEPLTALWNDIAGGSRDFESEERAARRRTPQDLLASDFNACARALHRIARSQPDTRDWTLFAIRRVLAEILVHLPVYRTYADARGRSAADAAIMADTVAAARPHLRAAERPLLDLVDRWLGGEAPRDVAGVNARRARLQAIGRFQQLSSPVAAKSVEDTVFYRHGRLLSRNEVGANPARFALAPGDFHAECARRVRRFPRALLATATHDHKRGEDVRARLAVLSERPWEWGATVQRWRERNRGHRPVRGTAPDPIDEYMLYQTLVGAWPPLLAVDDVAGLQAFEARVADWQQKALREAKRHSSWSEPDEDYEGGCRAFLRALLDDSAFLHELAGFVDGIAAAGAVNGLAQTLIKLAGPGVPDLYQGCDWWDFSLVDPDNRRAVDWAARAAALDAGDAVDWQALLSQWRDGRIKQQLLVHGLQLRARCPAVFDGGSYRPLPTRGERAAHAFGFARSDGETAVLAVVTRLPGTLCHGASLTVPPAQWADTRLELPRALAGRRWRCLLGMPREVGGGTTLPLAEVLSPVPVQLLQAT